jgi:branched-chain amino acid transport system permease protein
MLSQVLKVLKILFLVVLAGFLIVAPNLLTSFYLRVLTEMIIYGLFASAINILAGYTGLSPLGHAGIFGVAAYTVGYLTVNADASMAVAFPAGVVGALLISALFGVMAIRTSGIYFLMITLAEGMIVWGLAFRWGSVTGAENGLRGISRPEVLHAFPTYYYLVLVSIAILLFVVYRVINSPFGLTLKGIREGERRMQTLGYNVALHKWLGFMLSGLFTGFAGSFYVYYNNFVSPATVEFARSAEGLLMTILGGTGTFAGPLVGSAIVTFVRHQVSLYTDRWPMIMGSIYVVTILLAPDGILGGGRRLIAWLTGRRRPALETTTAGGKGVTDPTEEALV